MFVSMECIHGMSMCVSCASERSRRGQRHHLAQKGTDVKKKQKKKPVQQLDGGTAVCGRSGQVLSLSLLVSALLSAYAFFRSFPLCLLSHSHRGPGEFGQFVPVALDFQADLANFWSVQYRKQFFFFFAHCLMDAAGS